MNNGFLSKKKNISLSNFSIPYLKQSFILNDIALTFLLEEKFITPFFLKISESYISHNPNKNSHILKYYSSTQK